MGLGKDLDLDLYLGLDLGLDLDLDLDLDLSRSSRGEGDLESLMQKNQEEDYTLYYRKCLSVEAFIETSYFETTSNFSFSIRVL